ncbi:MAG: hypothetical protein ACOZQL_10595 [Myxococcota bacterium]
MALTQLTDYGERAVAKLLAQYRDKPKLAGLVRELAERAQEIEGALFDAIKAWEVANASGAWLERLGEIVGEPRGGALDTEYRAFIAARIAANRSTGTVEDLLAVLKAWAGGTLPAHTLKQYFPAAVEMKLTSPVATASTVTRLLRLLKATRAAGIGQVVIYQLIPDANAFTFSSTGSPESSTAQGFGDTTNPATGGQMIGAERA